MNKLSADALRYYRRIGLFDARHKGDEQWIEAATSLLAAGVPVDVLMLYKELLKSGPQTQSERHALLKDQYRQVKHRLKAMQIAHDKLAAYMQAHDAICP